MLKRIYYGIRFKVLHFPNLLVRFFTKDKYYVCEECHKIHKRDGREVRLEEGDGRLLYHGLWYSSVGRNCFVNQQRDVRKLLMESLLRMYEGEE